MRNFTNIFKEFVAIKEQMCDALKVAGPVQYRNIMALALTLGVRP